MPLRNPVKKDLPFFGPTTIFNINVTKETNISIVPVIIPCK